MMEKTLHLIFQTHWDREWYFPYEQYRYRLMHVIERAMCALENHEIESFILDGQTLPLEDYLEVAEQKDKTRILSLIDKGQMIIGPWYIAMDEFLVHGESIIRNLEIGRKIAEKYGKNQAIGYLPDTFGHIGQMPQILKGFDIDNAIMWRGIHLKDSEFIWRGTDHEELFTLFLVDGYYHPELNQNDRIPAIKHYLDKISPYARTPHRIMTAGGDHLMPINQSLEQKIHELSAIDPLLNIQVSSYESYLKEIQSSLKDQSLLQITGELRDNSNAYILPNVLSTRSYLKVLNQTLEDHVIGFIEPLMALTHLHQEGVPYQYLEHLWKTILQNQPHDSICGCSVDEVHRENEMRAEKAMQMIHSLTEGLLHKKALYPLEHYEKIIKNDEDDDMRFSIFNPHPYVFRGVVEGSLWLKNNQITDVEATDENGHIYQVSIEKVDEARRFRSPLEYPPFFRPGYRYHVKLMIDDLKPLSLSMLTLTPKEPVVSNDHEGSHAVENDYLKVTLNEEGTLDIFDKIQNKMYNHWHAFYASMDAGDSYNYAKPDQDTYSYPRLVGQTVHKKTNLFETLNYQLELEQPEAMDVSRKYATSAKITSKIDVQLTLLKHERIVRVKTHIDQKAKDQRLRLKFPLGVLLDTHLTDSAFELVERVSNRKELYKAERLKEVPVVVDPSLSMLYGTKNNQGIAFYHRGLHETQMVSKEDKTIAEITLNRSVGYLSRDDFGTRGGAAGPNLPTPEAQANRKLSFEYAFGPVDDAKQAIVCYKEAMEFRNPPRILSAYGMIQHPLIKKDKDDIIMSSLRLIDQDTVEIRLWNPLDQERSTILSSDLPILKIEERTLDQRWIQDVHFPLQFKPHQIKTLHIKYKNR
jgi:alpha-mannosidase